MEPSSTRRLPAIPPQQQTALPISTTPPLPTHLVPLDPSQTEAMRFYTAPQQDRPPAVVNQTLLNSLPPNRALPQPTPTELASALNTFAAAPPNRELPQIPMDTPQQTTMPNRPIRPSHEAPMQSVKKSVSKPPLAALSYRAEVPINAPFRGELANITFKPEHYLEVARKLNLLYPNTPSAKLLNSPDVKKMIADGVSNFYVISNLNSQHANFVACNRDLYHVPPHAPADASVNHAILGSDGSAIRNCLMIDTASGNVVKVDEQAMNPYIQPGAQVSILQRTPMVVTDKDGIEKVVVCHFVSVAPPALDDRTCLTARSPDGELDLAPPGQMSKVRPETKTYLDTSVSPPELNEFNYKTSHDTLGDHIITAARKCEAKRVILSGFGVNNFIGALETIDSLAKNTNYHKTAQLIAAEALAKTIIDLRKDGRGVFFSDVFRSNKLGNGFAAQAYWDLVNDALAKLGAANPDIAHLTSPLTAVDGERSALGNDWVMETDLIVNAWDPHSLVGNGLLTDCSFDGFAGIYTILHAIHAAACLLYQVMMIQLLQRHFRDINLK